MTDDMSEANQRTELARDDLKKEALRRSGVWGRAPVILSEGGAAAKQSSDQTPFKSAGA